MSTINKSSLCGPLGVLLLVEDSKADIRLVMEALQETETPPPICIVEDGEAAIAYLREEDPNSAHPGLVLLDLNLPKKRGLQVLAEMKSDERLKRIPVVVLTGSRNEDDVHAAYELGANCYVAKPMDFDDFAQVIKLIVEFWLQTAILPRD
jgi:chemotaxis family two-component system response regulator Rcp1